MAVLVVVWFITHLWMLAIIGLVVLLGLLFMVVITLRQNRPAR
jgi:hypothetical protein